MEWEVPMPIAALTCLFSNMPAFVPSPTFKCFSINRSRIRPRSLMLAPILREPSPQIPRLERRARRLLAYVAMNHPDVSTLFSRLHQVTQCNSVEFASAVFFGRHCANYQCSVSSLRGPYGIARSASWM